MNGPLQENLDRVETEKANSTDLLTSFYTPFRKDLDRAYAAADVLAVSRGIKAEVIDLRSLVPLDMDTILASVAVTGRCVIVHEAARQAGFGAEIAARLADEGLASLMAPVIRATGVWKIFGAKADSIETGAGKAYFTAETAKDGASVVRRYSMILQGGTFSGYVAAQPNSTSKRMM